MFASNLQIKWGPLYLQLHMVAIFVKHVWPGPGEGEALDPLLICQQAHVKTSGKYIDMVMATRILYVNVNLCHVSNVQVLFSVQNPPYTKLKKYKITTSSLSHNYMY